MDEFSLVLDDEKHEAVLVSVKPVGLLVDFNTINHGFTVKAKI